VNVGDRFNPHKRFPLGIFIAESLCKYRGISPGAKLVYGRLCRYAGESGEVYPSMARLGEEIGIAERQAREYIQELEATKFIEVDRENKHYRKNGSGGTNMFFFLWHEALEGDRGKPRKAPPPRQSTAGVPRRFTAALTPAVNCRQRESISLRESAKESPSKADTRAAPRKTCEASPVSSAFTSHRKTEETKADSPAKTASDEPSSPVKEKKLKADPEPSVREQTSGIAKFPPWTGIDVGQIQKLLSAFMDGDEPPVKLIEWICTTFEGVCPALDVCAALEAAWNRRAAPGKKNAPRNWNWFYTMLRNALIPGEASRLPEQPAVANPVHEAEPSAMNSGIEAIELAFAPRSIVESVRCNDCGGYALVQYADGIIEGCGCRIKRGADLDRISESSAPGIRSYASGRRRSGSE
jgi:hypothetical protein